MKQTDSMKETLVSNALEEFYRQKNVRTICTGNIRRKIKREVGNLRQILKFKSKQKTAKQNQAENEYKITLSNVFPIEKSIDEFDDTRMESDEQTNDQNGIICTRFFILQHLMISRLFVFRFH